MRFFKRSAREAASLKLNTGAMSRNVFPTSDTGVTPNMGTKPSNAPTMDDPDNNSSSKTAFIGMHVTGSATRTREKRSLTKVVLLDITWQML